jgi:hypothetical protein
LLSFVPSRPIDISQSIIYDPTMKRLACFCALFFTLGLLICVPAAAQTDGSCTNCERFDEYFAYCGDYDGSYVNCQDVCDDIACSCRSQTGLGGCTVDEYGNHHFYAKHQALLITPDQPFSPRYTVVAARVSRAQTYALLIVGKSRT